MFKKHLWLAALLVLAILALLYAKTTIYTITNRRLVMRFGVALPMMVNIPWERVDAADLKTHGGDSGSIALTLSPAHKASYWLLWPHAKPWRFSPVQPMLRCIEHPMDVAERLRQVVGQPAAAVTPLRPAASADAGIEPAAGSRTAAYS